MNKSANALEVIASSTDTACGSHDNPHDPKCLTCANPITWQQLMDGYISQCVGRCKTFVHKDCANYQGKCATFGCGGTYQLLAPAGQREEISTGSLSSPKRVDAVESWEEPRSGWWRVSSWARLDAMLCRWYPEGYGNLKSVHGRNLEPVKMILRIDDLRKRYDLERKQNPNKTPEEIAKGTCGSIEECLRPIGERYLLEMERIRQDFNGRKCRVILGSELLPGIDQYKRPCLPWMVAGAAISVWLTYFGYGGSVSTELYGILAMIGSISGHCMPRLVDLLSERCQISSLNSERDQELDALSKQYHIKLMAEYSKAQAPALLPADNPKPVCALPGPQKQSKD